MGPILKLQLSFLEKLKEQAVKGFGFMPLDVECVKVAIRNANKLAYGSTVFESKGLLRIAKPYPFA